jgi:hypothetical protein
MAVAQSKDAENIRKLVIVNQAPNYLTIGLANAFNERFDKVVLVCGGLHSQGLALDQDIEIHLINRWYERPNWKKALSYLIALVRVWWLLWTRYRRHEVLFVSVPPMGYLLNLFVRNRFSMIIWDLYPDIFEITGMRETHPLYRVWAWLNRHSFRKAWRLFSISDVMAEAMTKYVPRDKIIVLRPSGIPTKKDGEFPAAETLSASITRSEMLLLSRLRHRMKTGPEGLLNKPEKPWIPIVRRLFPAIGSIMLGVVIWPPVMPD